MLIDGLGPGTRADLVALGVTGVAIWSLHVVTPYDHLSLILMLLMHPGGGPSSRTGAGRPTGHLAGRRCARRRRGGDPGDGPGRSAALVAVSIIDRAAIPRPLAAVAALAGAATYIALRLDAHRRPHRWRHLGVNVDLGTVSVFGIVVVRAGPDGVAVAAGPGALWCQEPAGAMPCWSPGRSVRPTWSSRHWSATGTSRCGWCCPSWSSTSGSASICSGQR